MSMYVVHTLALVGGAVWVGQVAAGLPRPGVVQRQTLTTRITGRVMLADADQTSAFPLTLVPVQVTPASAASTAAAAAAACFCNKTSA